jgi:hypothetical protein
MGGKSTSENKQTQTSQTAPWAEAIPTTQGILAQVQGGLKQTGLTGAENTALAGLSANAQQGNPYAGALDSLTRGLFAGGGATDQNANISQNLADYNRRLGATADGQNLGPNGNPMLQSYLNNIGNDVQTRVNGMFAGAGRDFSGMNQQTLSRGIGEATAPILANQYNTDFNNMRGAADALYGAGNNTAGLLTGNQQQGLSNQVAGAQMAPQALDAKNYGQKMQLEIEAMRRGIPVQALGLLAQIGIPIAGLGGQSSGTATGNTTNQMSGAQQFGLIAGGLGSLFGGGRRV